jgi:hypothetical protein
MRRILFAAALSCLCALPALANAVPNFVLTGGSLTVNNPCILGGSGQGSFTFTGPNVTVTSGGNLDFAQVCGALSAFNYPFPGATFEAFVDVTASQWIASSVVVNGSPVASNGLFLPFAWGGAGTGQQFATLSAPPTDATTFTVSLVLGNPPFVGVFPAGFAPPNSSNGYIVAAQCVAFPAVCNPEDVTHTFTFVEGTWVATWTFTLDIVPPPGCCSTFTYNNTEFTLTFHPVPEPTTLLLVGSGVAGVWMRRRKLLHS